MDEWKVIPDIETGLYSTNRKGQVRNNENGRLLKPRPDKNGYSIYYLSNGTKNNMKYLKLHRLLAQAFIPNPNNYSVIDHIDRDKTNNDLSNLRWVSRTANNQNLNKRHGSTSRFLGVHYVKNTINTLTKPYIATIRHNKKKLYLGYYKTKEESGRAYDRKTIEIYGEHASTNFPQEQYLTPN